MTKEKDRDYMLRFQSSRRHLKSLVVGLLRSVKKRNDVDRQVKALYSKAEWKSICKFAVPTPFLCKHAALQFLISLKKINK